MRRTKTKSGSPCVHNPQPRPKYDAEKVRARVYAIANGKALEKFKQHHLTIEAQLGIETARHRVRTRCMATSAAGARTMLMYHGNTLAIANAIQSEMLGTEKIMIFTWGCKHRQGHARNPKQGQAYVPR